LFAPNATKARFNLVRILYLEKMLCVEKAILGCTFHSTFAFLKAKSGKIKTEPNSPYSSA
jgi:hypothetical protein